MKGNEFVGGAVTSAWITARQYWGIHNGTSVSKSIVGVGQFSSQKALVVGMNVSNPSKVTLYKYDGTTYTDLADESGASWADNTLQKVDIHINNYGVSATVDVYVGGVLVISFNGDVTVSGMTNFNCCIAGPYTGMGSQAFVVSEMIIADEDTRTFSLFTQAGTGTGWDDLWTGAYTDCNPITINDANSVYTQTAGQDEAFALTSLPSGTFSVKAVLAAARAQKTSGSPIGTLKLGWYTSSTVAVDSGHALTSAWECYENLALLNPVTASNWTQSDIGSLQEDLQSAT